jgi:hypothetical protein
MLLIERNEGKERDRFSSLFAVRMSQNQHEGRCTRQEREKHAFRTKMHVSNTQWHTAAAEAVENTRTSSVTKTRLSQARMASVIYLT